MTIAFPELLFGPDQLRDEAKHLMLTDAADRHWSRLAVVLGRIEDERLFEGWGYATARAFAEEELQMPPRDFVTLLQLWRMIQQGLGSAGAEVWHAVPKSRALLIRKVMALGADAKEWIAKAEAAETTEAFRQEIQKRLGEEPWTVWKVSVPVDLVPLIDAALLLALPEALGEPNPDPDRVRDKDARFRCLEAVVTEFVQAHGGAQAELAG